MKTTRKILLCGIASLSIISSPAQADDETKRLIGGIAAGLVGMAINEMANQDEAQAEDIQWNDKQKPKKSSAAASEKTKNIQRDLKELGYYQGTVDGISGSGTQQAILKWEDDNCLEDDSYCRDGRLDQIELDVLKDQAETKRNNEKVTARKAQQAKEHAEEEKLLASASEEDVEDWLNDLRKAVNHNALFPECRSKQALSDIQDVAQNAAYSNLVNVQIFDLVDATEIPNNIDVLLKEYRLSALNKHPNITVKDKTDTAPIFKDKRRLCIANAVTNSGNVPIQYSFHVVEGGISDEQRYYVEYEKMEESTYDILNSPDFYKRLYVKRAQ